MTSNIGVVIVDKSGSLKNLRIKTFVEDELYKKCGFKTSTSFNKQSDWRIRTKDLTYIVSLYGKETGKANSENKYDFPPPNDNTLFFGNCVLVCHTEYKGETKPPILETIDIALWGKLHDKLFGGFDDLTSTTEDDNEEDELDKVPDTMKTKNGGYLKDGFVVEDDSNESVESVESVDGAVESVESDTESIESDDDACSELSEESYIVET